MLIISTYKAKEAIPLPHYNIINNLNTYIGF